MHYLKLLTFQKGWRVSFSDSNGLPVDRPLDLIVERGNFFSQVLGIEKQTTIYPLRNQCKLDISLV